MFAVELEKTGKTYCAIVNNTDYVVERETAQEAIAFAWVQSIMDTNEDLCLKVLRKGHSESDSDLELIFMYLDEALYGENDTFLLNEQKYSLRDLMNNRLI